MKTRAGGARGDPASWRLELGEPAGTAMGRTLHGDSAATQLFLTLHGTLQFRKCLHSHPFLWDI